MPAIQCPAFGPHNQRYVQVPAAAGALPQRSPRAYPLKGAAAAAIIRRAANGKTLDDALPCIAHCGHGLQRSKPASGAMPVRAQNRASGSRGPAPRRVGENPCASYDAIREKSPSRYDGTSESPVAANNAFPSGSSRRRNSRNRGRECERYPEVQFASRSWCCSRCFSSANERDFARRWNRPLPPLITWSLAAPNLPSVSRNPFAVGGFVLGGAAVLCAIAEPCGAAVAGGLGLGGVGVLVTQ